MEEMNIISLFRGLLARVLVKLLKKQFEINSTISIGELNFKSVDGDIRAHLVADVVLSKEDAQKLFKQII